MKKAIIKDINKEYLEAVNNYEDEINNQTIIASIESYSNLAFIYWSFAFELFEFNIPNNITDEISSIGGERYSKIIELGLTAYPKSVELNFWKKYFAHIGFNEEFSEKDCKKLMKSRDFIGSNIPYFFLYLYDKNKYRKEKKILIEECNKKPTAKNIYIKSVLI